MFRTVPLSIIRSFSLYTQQQYMCWHLASRIRKEYVEFYSENKFEKLVHLVGFIIRRLNLNVAERWISLKCYSLGPSSGPIPAVVSFGCAVKTLLSTYILLHEDSISVDLLFFRRNKIKIKILSTPSFGGEVKPSVPCRRFTACKRSLNLRGSRNLGKITGQFLAHSSTFRC